MHGLANMGPGGAFHDVTNVIRAYGIVPESVYSGNPMQGNKHDHSELDAALKSFLDVIVKNENKISSNWKMAVNGILDAYLGKLPEKFDFNGKSYTARTFADFMGFKPDDYLEFTSFTHHPLYRPFVLEVPDNWAWNQVWNVSLSEMQEIADHAIGNDFSVAWGADVSERGFSFRNSLAVVPLKEYSSASEMDVDSVFLKPLAELTITPEIRQTSFDDYTTQDDHGMHIVGAVKDQTGKRYYTVKNSWGADRNFAKGYFYCSLPYYLYKTTSIMVHRNAVPKAILAKLKS
jgi:bleomycin hydrolase